MKRATTILLALLLVLSLAACGGGGTTTPTPEPTQAPTATPEPTPEPLSLKDVILGTWVCYYEFGFETGFTSKDDILKQTIEVYKGGSGRIYWRNETRDEDSSNVPLSWTIDDEILNIVYSIAGSSSKEGYEYDKENDTLNSVDGKLICERQQ